MDTNMLSKSVTACWVLNCFTSFSMIGAVILLLLAELLLECCCSWKACVLPWSSWKGTNQFCHYHFSWQALTYQITKMLFFSFGAYREPSIFTFGCSPGRVYPITSHFTATLRSSIDGNTHQPIIVLEHGFFTNKNITVSQKVFQACFIDSWAQHISIDSIVLPSLLLNPTSLPQCL